MIASAVILMYHRISDPPFEPEEGDYVLPPALFEAQMRRLAALGRAVLPLEALAGDAGPARSVVLTFDDGCASDAALAAPLLRSLGMTAAFFVNPARCGLEGRCSWDTLRALDKDGFRIGSHGLDHTLFDALDDGALRRQVAESRRWLESELGRPVDALSLPGGSGGARAVRFAREAGYRFVLGSRPGVVRGPASGSLLPRVAMRVGQGLAGFEAAVDQDPAFLRPLALRYRLGHGLRSLIGASAYGRLRRLGLRAPRRSA